MMPWQTVAMQAAFAGESYVPLAQIEPPAGTPSLTEAARPLWRGLHLLRGLPLPPDMEGEELTERCRAADLWTEVPLVAVGLNGSAVTAPVLLGRLPRPEIDIIHEEQWLTPQAAEAARDALRLVGKDECGFLLLPRFLPGSMDLIDGASLGLPLAVAALRLCAGKPLPQHVVLTGQVDVAGKVLAVGHIPEKRACARKGYYPARIFVYPAGCQIDAEPLPESLPVERLEDADALLDLIEAGNVAGIAGRLPLWRRDPAEFFSWLNNNKQVTETAQTCLLGLAKRQGWCMTCPDDALSNALEALRPYWEKVRHDTDLRRLLTGLFPHDRVKALPASRGLLTLAENCKTMNNHCGRSADTWIGLSERCLEELMKTPDISVRADALTIVMRSMISTQHNAYRFRLSDIPQDWLDKVHTVARLGASSEIGKIYGFLTQHYAFCAENEAALDYAERSLEHFTDKRDRSRRHLDRIYLFLDSGRPDDARRELDELLDAADDGAPLAEQVARQDDAYIHAAFVRLCRTLPRLLTGYPVAEILAKAKMAHPWQLWACNCGWLLAHEQPELARRCLGFSRDACLADSGGITLHPMTLLPLAALFAADLAPQAEILRQTEDVLRMVKRHCDSGQLHKEYFAPLFSLPDAAAVLAEVVAHAERYFPFNYR